MAAQPSFVDKARQLRARQDAYGYGYGYGFYSNHRSRSIGKATRAESLNQKAEKSGERRETFITELGEGRKRQ